jgi:hypothetical protein
MRLNHYRIKTEVSGWFQRISKDKENIPPTLPTPTINITTRIKIKTIRSRINMRSMIIKQVINISTHRLISLQT